MTAVHWNVCPDCGDSHPGGAACHGELDQTPDGIDQFIAEEQSKSPQFAVAYLHSEVWAALHRTLPGKHVCESCHRGTAPACTCDQGDCYLCDRATTIAVAAIRPSWESREEAVCLEIDALTKRATDAERERNAFELRAEQAEAAVQRVRGLATKAAPGGLSAPPADCSNTCFSDACNCSGKWRVQAWSLDPAEVLAALEATQPPVEVTQPPVEVTQPEHTGGNAEDCPACSGQRDLPWPFICPAGAPSRTSNEHPTEHEP